MTNYTSIELRIKILSLADEARHIRRWEQRLLKARHRNPKCQETYMSLRDHRKGVVSDAARNTLLAFGFLRGLTYKSMENRRYSNPGWKEIEAMARRYGGDAFDTNAFQAWKTGAGDPDQRWPKNTAKAA